MPKQASHVQKKAQSFRTPLTSVELVVNGLNGENLSGKTKRTDIDPRVLRVFVKRFQRLDLVLARMDPATLEYEAWKMESDAWRCISALNRLFSRYRLLPNISPAARGGRQSGWCLHWARIHASQPWLEVSRVLAIEKLASEGRIQSFKQCGQCQRWLYARFSHQRFCSETCREEFHRSDMADKARRRDWARSNYQIHKTKNVK